LLAFNDYVDIDGNCEMYAKIKSIISPGLVNLIRLELVFLLLACYVGISMWTDIDVTSINPMAILIFGMLFLSISRRDS